MNLVRPKASSGQVPASGGISRHFWELVRFVLVGLANVCVDLGVYVGLMYVGTQIWFAKAVAFICGTLFSYWANRVWTFKAGDGSAGKLAAVFGLYSVSMAINVSINSIVIHSLTEVPMTKAIAYVCALVPSAALNFVGMKVLFQSRRMS